MRALRTLLGELELPTHVLGAVRLRGDDPHFASPHRLAGAMAVAMAAAAAAAAALGTVRGLPAQDLTVELGEAARHVFPQVNWAPRLDGQPLPAPHEHHRALLLGIYRTRDGRAFVPCALGPRERAAWCRLLGCAATAPALAAAVAARDGAWLEARAAQAGLSGTCCRTAAAWANHPQGRYLSRRPVVDVATLAPEADPRAVAGLPRLAAAQQRGRTRLAGTGAGRQGRRWPPPGPAGRPLQGLRVLVLGRAFAGPLVGRTLAEQGAEVLHVGHPSAPEAPAVYAEGFVGGRSAAADLRRLEARQQVRALAVEADVVVDNGRAGVAEGFGLGAAQLAAIRPGLVHVRLDAFGTGGPWAGRPGYDMNACAAAGLMLGRPDGRAQHVASVLLCDFVAGYLAAAGACAALLAQAQGSTPDVARQVHVTLTKVASWCLALGTAPGGADAAPTICPLPRVRSYPTALGALRRLVPAVDFSHTPAAWPPWVLGLQGGSPLRWTGGQRWQQAERFVR